MAATAAALETLSVASILPFMMAVLDPGIVERHPAILAVTASLGATTPRGAILCLGILTALALAIGNAAAALNLLVHERFGARTQERLATTVFSAYLAQPYAFHLERDAASLLKVLITDTTLLSLNVINPFLAAVSKGLVVLGILALLLRHDPAVAATAAVVLACAYLAAFGVVRRRQRALGSDADARSLERQRITREALAGVKEIVILGREREMVARFQAATRAMAAAQLSNRMAANLPRHLLETVAFGGILLATLLLLARDGPAAASVVPALALYALAGYRLMPALHVIFAAALSIRFHLPVLRAVHADLALARALPQPGSDGAARAPFTQIRFASAGFSYPGRPDPALEDIDLAIGARECVGLVGRSGAGKSTLADLVLGVHEPTRGEIRVNGERLAGAALHSWRRQVGYVPQQVFLANATIAENVALGLPPERIDRAAVRRAVGLAQMDEFVASLPQGLDTIVGERGLRLSGGQRQRIGVARALYGDPQVLVLDEATSALDGLTEDALMDEVRALQGDRTVIVIAHRARTVEACGRIVMLERGRVVADGSRSELMARSLEFRRLVGGVRAASDAAAG